MRTLLLLLAFVPAVAAAQGTQIMQGAGPGGQLPPRDARPTAPGGTPAGTASIRGRVFAADTGKPLRRARIHIGGPIDGQDTSTDADGRYEIDTLPAGQYTLTVTRSGYLRLSYGQRRPFEQGKLFNLANGQRADNVDFTLPKMSLITGRVLDEANEPISGVRVMAMRPTYFEGRRRLVPVGQPASMTDDAGQYRILGLTPGSYFVIAEINETWTVVENGIERTMGYAQTYYPGVAGVTDARRVTVDVGQEAANTDFALVPGRTATVSGRIYDSQGRPAAGRSIQFGEVFRGPGTTFSFSSNGTTIAADGTFKIPNISPGEYTISLRTTTDINGVGVQESAAMPITVSGVDIDNVSLITSSGWSLNGTVVTDTGAAPPTATAARMRIIAQPVNSDSVATGPLGGAADDGRVTDNATFAISGLLGAMRLRANMPDGWVVQSIQFEGRNVTDEAIDARSGDIVTGVQVVVSNKVNVVAGSITDAKGAPTDDGTVLVFADDSQKWIENSRFVRSARPDQQGTFQIKGLPNGDYLAVALEYVEDGSWNDPDFLESIRRYGQRITLTDAAGSQTVALKLISPP